MNERLKPETAKILIDYIFAETCPFCGEQTKETEDGKAIYCDDSTHGTYCLSKKLNK